MSVKKRSPIWAAGIGLFTMFSGSGNLVFPLLLGVEMKSQAFSSYLGLFSTGVIVPFLGVLSMIRVQGDLYQYFRWLGKWGKIILCCLIIALIGPFGVIPRCLTITYASIQQYFPSISLLSFSTIACILLYFATINKGRHQRLLGKYLGPTLFVILIAIIIKGFFGSPALPQSSYSAPFAIKKGFTVGYNTMDLLATYFFTKTVIGYFNKENYSSVPSLIKATVKAGSIGMGLIALIYASFITLGALYSNQLSTVAPEHLLMSLSNLVLGKIGGVLASVAIALACLTTAMALVEVSSNFISIDLTKGKAKKSTTTLVILCISLFISTFNFSGIAKLITPILKFLYPFLIVLAIFNIGYRIYYLAKKEKVVIKKSHKEKLFN